MAEVNLNCCLTSKMTADEFLKSFLFGIAPENGDTGEVMSNEVVQTFIDLSYEYLEQLYDVTIIPKKIHEHQDFYLDQAGRSYWMFHTNQVPILWDELHRDRYPITIKAYFGAGINPTEFPNDWLRVNDKQGSVHVYPTVGSMGSFLHQFTAMNFALGTFRNEYVPQYFEVEYIAGMCPIPKFVNSLVGKIAYIYLGNILGDVAYGAGIASYSLGLDGLSESLATTQSASFNAYSARVTMYKDELKQELPLFKAKYGCVNLEGI